MFNDVFVPPATHSTAAGPAGSRTLRPLQVSSATVPGRAQALLCALSPAQLRVSDLQL